MYSITGSIVLYNNKAETVQKAINSFLNTKLSIKLYIIDNSPDGRKLPVFKDERIEYISCQHNIGFGAGHNIAIRMAAEKSKYFLILNPDIYFDKGTLEKLFGFMENNNDIGSVMPKVLYPDGSLQYLCRLLPNPYDMLLKKINSKIFGPLLNLQKSRYELRFADYNKPMDAPYLSGCFMFIRTEVFEKVGIFDERFFIYFEDVDLSRRIRRLYRTHYCPEAVICHGYERGSNKDMGHFRHLIFSGVKYFNKWGWFFDRERKSVNNETIRRLDVLEITGRRA